MWNLWTLHRRSSLQSSLKDVCPFADHFMHVWLCFSSTRIWPICGSCIWVIWWTIGHYFDILRTLSSFRLSFIFILIFCCLSNFFLRWFFSSFTYSPCSWGFIRVYKWRTYYSSLLSMQHLSLLLSTTMRRWRRVAHTNRDVRVLLPVYLLFPLNDDSQCRQQNMCDYIVSQSITLVIACERLLYFPFYQWLSGYSFYFIMRAFSSAHYLSVFSKVLFT